MSCLSNRELCTISAPQGCLSTPSPRVQQLLLSRAVEASDTKARAQVLSQPTLV